MFLLVSLNQNKRRFIRAVAFLLLLRSFYCCVKLILRDKCLNSSNQQRAFVLSWMFNSLDHNCGR